MNRRQFLKYAPLAGVAAVATSAANANPPDKLPLPVTLVGTDGVQLTIRQEGENIYFQREGVEENHSQLTFAKPTEAIWPKPSPFGAFNIQPNFSKQHDLLLQPQVWRHG